MSRVGVRNLKNGLSRYLKQVRRGETVIVTDRGHDVAYLLPIAHEEVVASLRPLLESGLARWDGGKPQGLSHPPKTRGKTLSQIILEEREE